MLKEVSPLTASAGNPCSKSPPSPPRGHRTKVISVWLPPSFNTASLHLPGLVEIPQKARSPSMQAKDWGGEGGEELTGLPQMDLGAKAFSLSCEVATMANQEATRVLRPFPSSTAVTFATGSLPALTKGLRKIQPFPSSKQTWTEKSEAWGKGVCPAWAAPSSSPAPQPALILRREGTYRPRRPEWASSRGSHPWPGGALNHGLLC